MCRTRRVANKKREDADRAGPAHGGQGGSNGQSEGYAGRRREEVAV